MLDIVVGVPRGDGPQPVQDPFGGPNYFFLDPNALYRIHIDNTGDGVEDITFESLEADDLGDGAALLRYTTAVALPDGTQATVPALIGAVQDGDRLLVLMNLETSALSGGVPAAGAAPLDPAAFADLLEQAYEAQAEALD